MIPPILHRIWVGGPMPDRYREWGRAWAELHRGWTLMLWGEDDLAGLPMYNRDLFDAAETEAPTDALRWRVDIARLEILYRYGGIYVDCDTEPLKPLDPLLRHGMFLPESANDPSFVTNAVMGAEAGHPFLQRVLNDLAVNAATYRGGRLVDTVGGKYLTRMITQHRPDGVAVLPWRYFAGQSIRDRDAGRAPNLSEAYCNHRWDNSLKRKMQVRR